MSRIEVTDATGTTAFEVSDALAMSIKNLLLSFQGKSIENVQRRPADYNELLRYASDKGVSNVEAYAFWSWMEAAGWKSSTGELVKDWRACFLQWVQLHR